MKDNLIRFDNSYSSPSGCGLNFETVAFNFSSLVTQASPQNIVSSTQIQWNIAKTDCIIVTDCFMYLKESSRVPPCGFISFKTVNGFLEETRTPQDVLAEANFFCMRRHHGYPVGRYSDEGVFLLKF